MHIVSSFAVVLHYIGAGKKGTGDWCFQDGFISLQEIIKIYLYSNKMRGHAIILVIVSDCSHSGSWVRECMHFMDKQEIDPCGHAAKEKGILVQIMTSCLSHETPTELALSTNSFSNDKNTKTIGFHSMAFRARKICDGQHPSCVDFTHINCKTEDISSTCTIAPGSTWSKWILSQRMFLVRTNKNNRIKLDYVLFVDDDKAICDLAIDRTPESSDDFQGYGQILMSGWADEVQILGELVKLFDPDQFSIQLQL